jgi:hypothetical protein
VNLPLPDLLIITLATWRLSYMLVSEDGPNQIIARLRARFSLGGLTDCIYCMSVWIAAGLYGLWQTAAYPIVIVLAISGAAMMLRSYTGAGMHE